MKKTTLQKHFFIILFVIAIALFLSAGCTSEESSPVQTPETTAGEQYAPAASGEAVHYTELMKFLPTATSNWDSGEPYGMQTSYEGGIWSWASNNYMNKDGIASVDIVIQDTVGAIVGYQSVMESYFEIDTPEMKMEKVTIQGYPGWVVTDKMDDTYTQLIDINDRFIVWTQVTGGKKDYITVFNSMMNLKDLAALG